MCTVYTYDKNHPKLEAAAESWGWKCDGFLGASTLTNETIGAVDLPHLGPEAYNNMWQKTRSILAYIYDNYLDDYDFFWIGGDDFFLVVENLVNILATYQGEEGSNDEAKLIGQPVPNPHGAFCVGAPGYVLNRMAVKRFVEEVLPTCRVSIHAAPTNTSRVPKL